MRLIDDDHVVETLASDGSDQALHERILPRTRRSGHNLGDSHASQSALERVAVNSVAISVQPAWGRVVGKRVDHLLGGPDRGRMSRDIDVHNVPTLVRQYDEDEQHAARERRHGVHRQRSQSRCHRTTVSG